MPRDPLTTELAIQLHNLQAEAEAGKLPAATEPESARELLRKAAIVASAYLDSEARLRHVLTRIEEQLCLARAIPTLFPKVSETDPVMDQFEALIPKLFAQYSVLVSDIPMSSAKYHFGELQKITKELASAGVYPISSPGEAVGRMLRELFTMKLEVGLPSSSDPIQMEWPEAIGFIKQPNGIAADLDIAALNDGSPITITIHHSGFGAPRGLPVWQVILQQPPSSDEPQEGDPVVWNDTIVLTTKVFESRGDVCALLKSFGKTLSPDDTTLEARGEGSNEVQGYRRARSWSLVEFAVALGNGCSLIEASALERGYPVRARLWKAFDELVSAERKPPPAAAPAENDTAI